MAGDITLLKSFIDGQGAGAATYDQYAGDHDANYLAIETAVKQINAEIAALGGNNSTLVTDLLTSVSSPAIAVGIVDATSFAPVAFITGDTQIQIPAGKALTTVGKVTSPVLRTLTGSGSSGTRYIALRTDGSITLETSAAQGIMDLYSVTWTGAVFTPASLLRLEEILPAGHDFQNQKVQEDYGQGSDAAIPPYTYDRIADRIADIVRVMGAQTTSADAGQSAIGPMAFGGTVALPGFIPGDGSTHDTTSGFYRPAADQIGVSILATAAIIWLETVSNEPQGLLRAGTALSTPPLAFVGDADSGIGWVSADRWRLIVGGVSALELFESASATQALIPLGSASVPTFSFIGDQNTGIHSPGADRLALGTNAIIGLELNANQQRISATQGRASASEDVFNLANNSVVAITLQQAEQYDIGTYHDLVTNADRMTVPAGHGGTFHVSASILFDESSSAGTPNSGDRGIAITVNGTAYRGQRVPAVGAGDTELCVAADIVLVATDIVRVTGFQDSGGAMDVSALLSVRHVE